MSPPSQRPTALIVQAVGSNRERDVAMALELAGAAPTIALLADVLREPARLDAAQLVVLPGGFSYGDDLGAGRLWALELRAGLEDALRRFVARGRPVLGICNGFQALLKAGLLPGGQADAFGPQRASLAPNAGGRFECRWVWLRGDPRCRSPWLAALDQGPVLCPVAHGEGRFVTDAETLASLDAAGQLALRYAPGAAGAEGPAGYPANPNGSLADVAGVCNAEGNVLGLMPHPENHVLPSQHPRHTLGQRGGLALPLLAGGVALAAQV